MLLLSRIDPQVMAAAVKSGTLLARMRMTDAKRHPAISPAMTRDGTGVPTNTGTGLRIRGDETA